MILYVATERFSSTIRHFLGGNGRALRNKVRLLTYEELFFEGAGPVGHYIFTDFDRLSRYDLECASRFAAAVQSAEPRARILNHPLSALERFPLLLALHEQGINDFTAIRIEGGERPPAYPVFIRAEDGYGGPETGLIHSDDEFEAALADLTQRGLPRRGRIAVGFANRKSDDGYFHKYGAFRVGDQIVPHDLMFGRDWIVKMHPPPVAADSRDTDFSESDGGVAMEMQYINGNPHAETLMRAFTIAGIDYGRADYGVVNGRVQIYEINTNPHIPHRTPTARVERARIVQQRLVEAIAALDTPGLGRGRVKFEACRPRAHNLHWPRRRLPASLGRLVSALMLRK
jgi:hypothetical protein